VSFEVLSTYLILNVIIAIVLKNFELEFEQGATAATVEATVAVAAAAAVTPAANDSAAVAAKTAEAVKAAETDEIISIADIQSMARQWIKVTRSEVMPVSHVIPFLLKLFQSGHSFADLLPSQQLANEYAARYHHDDIPITDDSPGLPPPTASTAFAISVAQVRYLVAELKVPRDHERQTIHYIDLIYCLSLMKVRRNPAFRRMSPTLPAGNENVQLAKEYALRLFPMLSLSTPVSHRPQPSNALALVQGLIGFVSG
jgi:hypothetical protein